MLFKFKNYINFYFFYYYYYVLLKKNFICSDELEQIKFDITINFCLKFKL